MNLQITCHNWFGSICLTFLYDAYSNGLSPVCKSLWSFKTGVLVEYLSQFLQCLHWKGLYSANAPMCIFKSFSLEKVLAHSSHAESPFPACSDHVNLQTLPTWEKFCTTSATVKTLSNFHAVQVKTFKRILNTVWLFSAVCFQMRPQTVCPRRCKVTLVAFVWLFSTVCFQMFPQVACPRRGIVTLVAFVWLFSAVRFQMCPQIACLRRCKVTLVAFVWFFSTVRFQMFPQISCLRRFKVTLVAFFFVLKASSSAGPQPPHPRKNWGYIS